MDIIIKFIIWIDEYIRFFASFTPRHFINVFWFFFIFDLPRYVLIDLLVPIIYLFFHKKENKLKEKFWRSFLNEKPLVSVIIPGKNEGDTITRCVISLKEQTYKNIEIIVVDDGSDDNMEEICTALLKKGMIDKYIKNRQRGGKASAANLGFRVSRGKYIIHLDADSSLDRDAIEKILKYFYDSRVGAVAGNVRVREPFTNLITVCQAIEYMKVISIARWTKSYLGILRIVSGAFGAFRRSVIEKVGGWDIGPGLDGDITIKALKGRNKVKFAPDAICLTNVPKTFKSIIKQRLRWNRSLIRMRIRKHKDIFYPSANFNVYLFLSLIDNIFFNIFLTINWFIYHIFLLNSYPENFFAIFIMNAILYTIANYFQFLISYIFSERKRETLSLFLYIPLMFFYIGYILRPIRLVAYIEEFFFKTSYKDPWNPEKVSKVAKEDGM